MSMKNYASEYSNDDLYDMFANEADVSLLAGQSVDQIAVDLKDLAPDMADAAMVAAIIKDKADEVDYRNNRLPDIRSRM